MSRWHTRSWLLAALVGVTAVGSTGQAATPASPAPDPNRARAVAASAHVPADRGYVRGRAPSWVDVVPVDFHATVDPALARNGVYDLLHDARWRVAKDVERYVRHVRRAISSNGVEVVAQVRVEFEPSYQRLVLHHATIWRDGRAIDGLLTATERLLERESELERRVYRGSLTLDLVLSDVRAGDVIDYAYTVIGFNPVFGQASFSGGLPLSVTTPTRHLHAAVRFEDGRQVFHRALGETEAKPSATTEHAVAPPRGPIMVALDGGGHELRWERKDLTPPSSEDDVPPDYDDAPWVQLSSYRSWGEVEGWARPLFALPNPLPQNVVDRARELAAGKTERDDIVLAVLRFVQDDIRYLSVSLGPHSHAPHSPEKVLEQRFGDCKDKALLFVALLRALDIEAEPALVDSTRRSGVQALLPSPFAFDHAIARIRRGDGWVWVDPTHAGQGGTLSKLAVPEFGAALPVGPQIEALAVIDVPALTEPQTEVVTAYSLPQRGAAARLDVTSTYRGSAADDFRQSLARKTRAEMADRYLEYYTKIYRGIRSADALTVRDDREANHIVVKEAYEVPADSTEGELRLEADLIEAQLHDPAVTLRKMPLAIAHPVWIREVFELHLPWVPALGGGSQYVEDEAFSFSAIHRVEGTAFKRQVDYRSRTRTLAPEVVAEHVKKLDVARGKTALVLPDDVLHGDPKLDLGPRNRQKQASAQWFGWGTLGAIVVLVAAWRWRSQAADNARQRAFRRAVRKPPALGETAELPLRVANESDARNEFALQTCACGSAHETPTVTPVMLGGSALHAFRATCPSCGAVRRRYYAFMEQAKASGDAS